MSSAALELLNEAKIRMRNCEAFTPYQVPAPLWELTGKMIRDLAKMITAYGFPYSNATNRHQKLCLKTRQNRIVPVSISVPPATTVLTVGNSFEDCFYIIFKINEAGFGLIIWNKSVSVSELFGAMADLDIEMESRGFYDPKSQKRTTLFNLTNVFRVEEFFADKMATYELRETWDEDKVLAMFDEPERLAVVPLAGKRLLCLSINAQNPKLNRRLRLIGNAPRTPQELLERIVQQNTASLRS